MRSQWLSEFSLSAEDEQRLDNFDRDIQRESELFLGYPCNGIFDYSTLYRFCNIPSIMLEILIYPVTTI